MSVLHCSCRDIFDECNATCVGFLHARSWLKDVREHADPHLTCILVGNKVDLCGETEDSDAATDASVARDATTGRSKRKREVTAEEAGLWAKEEGLLFVEASAKSGVNVEFAFEEATRDILRKIHTGVFDDERVCVFLPASLEATAVTCFSVLWTVAWREVVTTEE